METPNPVARNPVTRPSSATQRLDYRQYDALGLAELVRTGAASANELLDIAIARAEAVNPKINAIVTPLYDYARAQIKAGLPDGPFTGVPFLLKDLLCAVAGTPLSNGSNALKGQLSTHDSELSIRFRNSGLVFFGKTNTPELGLMGVTEPAAFGPARNPWNLDHTPGGSSGGSAAAIAAGIVPMASGGDGGGSIRIPAACCGLFGLKPSRGRVPTGPDAQEFWDGAATEHVITRSVRDSAAMLDVICGPDDSSPYPLQKLNNYQSCLNQPLRKLRIGYTSTSFVGRPVSDEARAAVDHSVSVLQQLGHETTPIDIQLDGEALADSYLTLYFGHVAADLESMASTLGCRINTLDVEPTTKVLGFLGKTISAGDFVQAKRRWNDFARTMHRFHQQYDILLTPTLGCEPVRIGSFAPPAWETIALRVINGLGLHKMLLKSGAVKQMVMDNLEKLPFTQLANLTGQPAMSVPLFWTASGLPLGSQFIAPLGDEHTLLQLARQLEIAQPWMERVAEV